MDDRARPQAPDGRGDGGGVADVEGDGVGVARLGLAPCDHHPTERRVGAQRRDEPATDEAVTSGDEHPAAGKRLDVCHGFASVRQFNSTVRDA